jgi:hypothetical protein
VLRFFKSVRGAKAAEGGPIALQSPLTTVPVENIERTTSWRQAYAAHGVLCVKRALTASQVVDLNTVANYLFCARGYAQLLQNRTDELSLHLSRHLCDWGWAMVRYFRPELPDRLAAQSQSFDAVVRRLVEIAAQVVGKPGGGRFIDDHSLIKRMTATQVETARVKWHRDADAAGTAAKSGAAVNVWVPLVDVGLFAPSLELVLGSHRTMQSIPTQFQQGGYEVLDDEYIETRLAQCTRLVPTLSIGDVLIFDHHLVHQTQPMMNALVDRYTMECRVAFEE